MAKNDTVLLDGIIDERINERNPSDKRDEVFEYLSFEQILKDYDLSFDEIGTGAIDGRRDGGIDGFFIFINGHLLQDIDSFTWPRSGSEIDVYIINCKHHETFLQAPLDKLNASFYELLDFSISKDSIIESYSEAVLAKREELIAAYRKLSPRLNKFNINYFYASRGDSSIVGDEIFARAQQLVEHTESSFSNCEAKFSFIGASELVALHRQRPNFSLELPFVELLSRGENYILLSKLSDYFGFVSDHGKLRRYLFDSNVRDFMGMNPINEDIKETLHNEQSPDFWWLNNGVTILASGASVIGKSIKLSDIQIVNGLQTTESIHRHFHKGMHDSADRAVLVKVVVSNDDYVRDAIIRSTNNQTHVELASLHATDKIQRDIEDVLVRNGLYYERRKNYYTNMGHVASEIVTPIYIATGYVALVLKNPQRATRLKPRFMRSEEAYKCVFSDETPIELWPIIGHLLKRVERAIATARSSNNNGTTSTGELFLKRCRSVVAFCCVAKHFNSFNFSVKDLLSLSVSDMPDENLEEVARTIIEARDTINNTKRLEKDNHVKKVCAIVAEVYQIQDLEDWFRYGRKELIDDGVPNLKSKDRKQTITPEFLTKLNELLPEQPWKPGMQKAIIKELNCTSGEYFAATNLLIQKGLRYMQKDGVLYDSDGHVVGYDEKRVDPVTMKLIDPAN